MHVPTHTFIDAPRWIKATLALWKTKTLALISTSALFFFILTIISILLQILLNKLGGQLVDLFIMPLLFIVLSQCRAFDQNIRPPTFKTLLTVLNKQRTAFLMSGILYLFATEILYQIIIEPQRPILEPIFQQILSGKETIQLTADTSTLITHTAWQFLIGSMLIWALFAFQPALLGWFQYSAGKSFFFALATWSRNWQALILFALLFFLLIFTLFILTLFVSAFFPARFSHILLGFFVLGGALPLNLSAYYVVNREIFRPAHA